MLVVISGDERYENKDEEEKEFISRSMSKAILPQFLTELVDGRKSFIFSWNKKHRPIHEEALLHYFDSSKKGKKFVPQPKKKMENFSVSCLEYCELYKIRCVRHL